MMEDNTIKQMRVKFSAIEEAETSHRKLPSQSFKGGGDSRRVENRYRGESSDREVTYDYDYDYDYMESDEFRTAVAAAAFAIDSVEEKRRSAAKQRVDDSSSLSTNNSKLPARKKHMKDKIPSFSGAASNKKIRKNYKEDDTVPISSTPSLLSKKFSELKEKVPQSSRPAAEKADLASSRSSIESKPIPAARNHPEDIKADAWEKIQMDKIKQRYENLNAKIVEWEKEKKEKAQKKLSRNKDKKRGVQNYKSEMEMIDEIVQGARAQAEENRRKEEIKLKKKSDMIRLTGKIPTKTSCLLCF